MKTQKYGETKELQVKAYVCKLSQKNKVIYTKRRSRVACNAHDVTNTFHSETCCWHFLLLTKLLKRGDRVKREIL